MSLLISSAPAASSAAAAASKSAAAVCACVSAALCASSGFTCTTGACTTVASLLASVSAATVSSGLFGDSTSCAGAVAADDTGFSLSNEVMITSPPGCFIPVLVRSILAESLPGNARRVTTGQHIVVDCFAVTRSRSVGCRLGQAAASTTTPLQGYPPPKPPVNQTKTHFGCGKLDSCAAHVVGFTAKIGCIDNYSSAHLKQSRAHSRPNAVGDRIFLHRYALPTWQFRPGQGSFGFIKIIGRQNRHATFVVPRVQHQPDHIQHPQRRLARPQIIQDQDLHRSNRLEHCHFRRFARRVIASLNLFQ